MNKRTVLIQEPDRLRMLAPRTGRVRAVPDTDTFNEIDDQFAVVQPILSPERIRLEAIYAAPFINESSRSPGHGMQLSFEEIGRLLERLGKSPDGMVHAASRTMSGPRSGRARLPLWTTSSRGRAAPCRTSRCMSSRSPR